VREGGAEVLLDGVVASAAGAGDEGEAGGWRLGEEIDGAADGVGAVKRRSRSVEDVDAGYGVEGDRDVKVEVAGFGVVDAEAVEEDEGLLEGGAAEGEVGLNAVWGAGLEVEGGVLAEEVDDGVCREGLVARGDEVDGAIAFGEWEGLEGGGDGDALGDGGGLGWGGVGSACWGGWAKAVVRQRRQEKKCGE
jgi:hypothetical protein